LFVIVADLMYGCDGCWNRFEQICECMVVIQQFWL